MRARRVLFVIAGIALLLFPGCFSVDHDFKSIRNIALKECGKHFYTEHEFALGSFELWLADGIVGMTDADQNAKDILDHVSGVQVGEYKRTKSSDIGSKEILKNIDRRMKKMGLVYLVKSFSKDEVSAVYINRESRKTFNELYVVEVNDNEIIVVQITGNLEKVIDIAIREEGLDSFIDEGESISKK